MIARRAWLVGAAGATLGACAALPREAEGRRVVTLWYAYGGKNRIVLESLVDRFHREQRDVWVQATFQGDYFEALAKLRTALAAGVGPTFTHVVGEVVPYLDAAAVLEPLDAYPGVADLDLVPELSQAGAYVGGGARPLVAVPFNRSLPIAYVNAELLDRAGLRAPQTWGALREAARALTVRRGDEVERWGFACPISWWFWVALVGAAGGELVDRAGVPTLGGEAGVRALALWQSLVHDDRSMRPPPGRDYNAWQAAMQDFLSGRAAMIWSSTAFLRYVEETARFPVRAVPLPRDVRHAVPTGGTMFVVLRSAPRDDKLAAWSFLRWMLRPEQAMEWSARTGYLPVSRGAMRRLDDEGFYAAHPNDRVARGELVKAMAWPWSPELFRVQREVVEPRLEDAVLRRLDAAETMAAARREALTG